MNAFDINYLSISSKDHELREKLETSIQRKPALWEEVEQKRASVTIGRKSPMALRVTSPLAMQRDVNTMNWNKIKRDYAMSTLDS